MRRGRAYHVGLWDVFLSHHHVLKFWVVLWSCSVFVQKKHIKPKKPKNLKTFFKNLGFSSPVFHLPVLDFSALAFSYAPHATAQLFTGISPSEALK